MINSYIVICDLNNNQNYKNLNIAMQQYKPYAHISENVWIINTEQCSSDILKSLSNTLENSNKIFIAKLDFDISYNNFPPDLLLFINKNI